MADIRYKAKTSVYNDVVTSFPDDYTTGEVTLGDGTYEVTIEREDQKVNINALDETDYPWISRLKTAGLIDNEIAKIIDYRDSDSDVTTQILTSGSSGPQVATGDETNAKNAPYATVEELRVVLNDNNKYNGIKDIVTVSAPIIRGGLTGKYYVNKTGFSKDTILNLSYYKGKVVELGKVRELWIGGTDSWDETHDAEWAGGYLVNEQFGIDQFGVIFTGFIYVPQNKVGNSITFYLRTDDGSRLWLDGQREINMWQDQNMTETSGNHTFNSAGWHPITIEYYDQGGANGCELKWDGLGSKDYVPAEYLGYCPPSYAGPYKATTATETTYNSAGFYKITSTGKVKTAAGAVLAKKKVTAETRIFGSWTQATRAEFYAPWFSTLNDFTDGEFLNVTWLDSCPTGEGTSPNALKLGYWDNFDEDCAYSVNMLREERLASAPSNDDTNWSKFQDWDGDGNREFSIAVEQNANKAVELNGYYYYVDNRTGYDLFTQCWEMDAESPSERTATAWDVGWFNPKHSFILQGESDFKGGTNLRNYYNLMKQDYMAVYGWDNGASELNLDSGYDAAWNSQVAINPYIKSKVLKVVGISNSFQAYIDGIAGAQKSRDENNPACAVLSSYNADRVDQPLGSGGNWQDQGPLTTYWDDFNWISQKGFFVSTPFCEIVSAEEGEVNWGYISWNEVLPSGKGISLEGRAAAALTGFTSDPSTWGAWGTAYSSSNGQALNLNNAKFFQYKVIMTDTVQDGVRPVFKDVTITYLPQAETLYRRTEVE